MKYILKSPLVTEKNTYHSAENTYVFEVHLSSDKLLIKKEVEKYFKVKVVDVRTAVCRGHAKRNRFGISKAPKWKKAFVKLAEGEKIALFEGA